MSYGITEVDIENKDVSSLLNYIVDYKNELGIPKFSVNFDVTRSADAEDEYMVTIFNELTDIDFIDLDEEQKRSISRFGLGNTLFDALYRAAKEWGIV